MKRIFAAACAVSLAGLAAALIFCGDYASSGAVSALKPTYIFDSVILVEPAGLALTAAAGIALVLLGIFVARTSRGQRSRSWYAAGLIMLGAAALASGVGFQIRGLEYCLSSSQTLLPAAGPVELAAYAVASWGLAALCMAVCSTSARGGLRLWSQAGGIAAAFLYVGALCLGARYSVVFIISPKLLLSLAAAYVILFTVLDSMMLAFSGFRRYKLFIGGWAIAAGALAAYGALTLAGVSAWYGAGAVLCAGAVAFAVYVKLAALPEIRDI